MTSQSGVWSLVQSGSILNGTLNAKLNQLYQCQSKYFMHHYPRALFYDIPGSGRVSHIVVKLHSLCRWLCPDRSWERVHCCVRFSLCSSSDIGGGRSFSTLCFLVTESTMCVGRFWCFFNLLEPNLRRTVEWCHDRVSFIGIGSWVVMPWQTWSSSRQFKRHIWVVIDLQHVGLLVEMANAAHLVDPSRIWNWCLSGVKNVTVDIGAEIKN